MLEIILVTSEIVTLVFIMYVMYVVRRVMDELHQIEAYKHVPRTWTKVEGLAYDLKNIITETKHKYYKKFKEES